MLRVNYVVISVSEKNRKKSMHWRGGFIDRGEAVAEARRIVDAEGVEVLIDRDDAPPLRFSPISRARRQAAPRYIQHRRGHPERDC